MSGPFDWEQADKSIGRKYSDGEKRGAECVHARECIHALGGLNPLECADCGEYEVYVDGEHDDLLLGLE